MNIIQNIGKKQSRKVLPEDMERVRSLIPEMHKLCLEPLGYFKNGAYALAHCQVDQDDPLRFFVLMDGTTVINPQIIKRLGNPFRNEEGCMSKADTTCLLGVQRYKKIIVGFTGLESHDGQEEQGKVMEIGGLLALIFQHEIDHMNGRHIYSK